MPRRKPPKLPEKPDSQLAQEIEGFTDAEKADEVMGVLLAGGTIAQAAKHAGVSTDFVRLYQKAAEEIGVPIECPTDPQEFKRIVAKIQRAAVFRMSLRLFNEVDLIPRAHLAYTMGVTQDKAAINDGGPTSIHASYQIKMNPDELAERLRRAQEKREAIEVKAETVAENETKNTQEHERPGA